MATGNQNLTSDKARILSTSGTTGQFWRGDNSWSNTLANNLTLNKSAAASPEIQFTNTGVTGKIYSDNASGVTALVFKYGSGTAKLDGNGYFTAERVYNAVWNDYAEFRECDKLLPGICVQEQDNGHLIMSDTRLIPGAAIISDTYGSCMGETSRAKTPIAISGRVLAYTYRDRNEYHAGMAVCSAPNGTIDIMTREEIREYPDAIIGIVSEIPDYKIWGSGKVKVDNRIWIKIK